MQGLIATIDSLKNYFDESGIKTRDQITSKVAEMAYDFADAMLEQRQK